MKIARALCLAGIAALVSSGSAFADGISGGTIIGVFGGVVTSGNVLNDPSLGKTTSFDNSSTAIYSITNSTNPAQAGTPPLQSTGSSLKWGDNNGGSGAQSILNFFGAPIPSNFGQNFELGRITYSNGTSTLGSLIFGATISFYANSVSAQTFLGTDTISITTTSNLGASIAQDSDYINICGNQSNICGSSINAVENGNGLTVDLMGTIKGDPQLFINLVSLAPDQDPNVNGFIGKDAPAPAVPEPSTWAMMLLGFLGIFSFGYRRRPAPRVAA